VNESDGVILEKIVNYPNPASDYTTIQYTHNVPDENHELLLEIFDLSGRLVISISRNIFESGFVSEPIFWDLKNSAGSSIGPGVYPYKLTITTSIGVANISQKLVILK
jgi:flagellar hook assembly protein FlgD